MWLLVNSGTVSNIKPTIYALQMGGNPNFAASTDGEPLDGSLWVMGGGIFFMPGAGARISHNVITYNSVTSLDRGTAGAGMGISTGGSIGFWIIEHNQIVHNVNTYQGVKPNLGASGAGGWLTQSGRFENNVVSGNYGIAYTYSTGGGIEWGASLGTGAATVAFTNNLIENNEAGMGAGLLIAPIEAKRVVDASKSKSGQLIGVTSRYTEVSIAPRWTTIEFDFVENDMLPFFREYGGGMNPFFWCWDVFYRPEEVYLVRLTSSHVHNPKKANGLFYESFSLDMEGVLE